MRRRGQAALRLGHGRARGPAVAGGVVHLQVRHVHLAQGPVGLLQCLAAAHHVEAVVDDGTGRAVARGARVGDGGPAPAGGVEHQATRGVHVLVEVARGLVLAHAPAHQVEPACDAGEHALGRGVGQRHAIAPAVGGGVVHIGRGLGAPVGKAAAEAADGVDQPTGRGQRDVVARLRQRGQARPAVRRGVVGLDVGGVAGVRVEQPAGHVDAAVQDLGVQLLARQRGCGGGAPARGGGLRQRGAREGQRRQSGGESEGVASLHGRSSCVGVGPMLGKRAQ